MQGRYNHWTPKTFGVLQYPINSHKSRPNTKLTRSRQKSRQYFKGTAIPTVLIIIKSDHIAWSDIVQAYKLQNNVLFTALNTSPWLLSDAVCESTDSGAEWPPVLLVKPSVTLHSYLYPLLDLCSISAYIRRRLCYYTASPNCFCCTNKHLLNVCSEIMTTKLTRHRASTSMYSLTFRVHVGTPAQYGRNGTASLQITSQTPNLHVYFIAGACVRACVRSACGVRAGSGGLPLGSATHFHNVAIATHPVHRLQIRPIVHN